MDKRLSFLYKPKSLDYPYHGDGWIPVDPPVFKTVWRAALQAAVGSTPIHSRFFSRKINMKFRKSKDQKTIS